MKVAKILVSQPRPAVIEKSPFNELITKQHLDVEFKPLIQVKGVSLKEFLSQRIEILDHTCVIFTSRTTVDSFFNICEQARITIPETMKYICQTEAVALYLQKYIVYRKRKIFFADGTYNNFVELIVKHKTENFILAMSEPHKPELPDAMTKLKMKFSPAILARTVSADMGDLEFNDYGLIALYSPSDVKAVVEKGITETMPHVAVFGEGTLRAACEAGLTVRAMAPTREAPSMVKAIDIFVNKFNAGEEVDEIVPADGSQKEEFLRSQQSKLAKKTRVRRSTSTTTTRKTE